MSLPASFHHALAFHHHGEFQRSAIVVAVTTTLAGALYVSAPAIGLHPIAGLLAAAAAGALVGLFSRSALAADRRWLGALALASAAGLAYLCITRLEARDLWLGWPAPLRGAALGLLGGCVVTLGLLPRHLGRAVLPTPSPQAAPTAVTTTPSAAAPFTARAQAATNTVLDALAGDASDEAREARAHAAAFTVGVGRLVERLGWLERALSAVDAPALEARSASLTERAANTDDAETRADLERAATATAEQLARTRDLEAARDRLLARLEADVAALERVCLAVLARRAADADRDADAMGPLVAELGALTERMDQHRAAEREAADAARVI